MIVYDMVMNVLDIKWFPQHNIPGLISGITFVLFQSGEASTVEGNEHTHTHTHTAQHSTAQHSTAQHSSNSNNKIVHNSTENFLCNQSDFFSDVLSRLWIVFTNPVFQLPPQKIVRWFEILGIGWPGVISLTWNEFVQWEVMPDVFKCSVPGGGLKWGCT